MHARRQFVCLTVAMLSTLIIVGQRPAPVAAHTAPPAETSGAMFSLDGAHLAPGVTLRLAALGRGDALTLVHPVTPTDDGTRVQYAYGDVTEWYLRAGEQGGGIEQGITLATRPTGDGILALTIATPGAAALVNDAGDAATLIVPDKDKTRWQYNGLHVTDATGRTLPARLTQGAAGGIGITADDTDAVYPVTVDPFVQRQVINNPNTSPANSDQFGTAVALSMDGGTLVVGAPYTNGNHGSVDVFTRSGGSYGAPQTLNDPAAIPGYDTYGNTVAMSADGTILIVGAANTGGYQGRVYIYTRTSGSTFGTPQTLTEPPPVGNDQFGTAVAVSADGSTLVVGAQSASNGQGKVFVFNRSGGTYTGSLSLSEPTPGSSHSFGSAVALSADGSVLAVGTFYSGSGPGKAYLYTRISGNYGTPQILNEPNAGNTDPFGGSVALSADGNTLAVGAQVASGGPGKVFLYTRVGGTFTLNTTLSDPGASSDDRFGSAVSLSADASNLAVGTYGSVGTSSSQGKAYVFTRTNAGYALTSTLSDPGGTTNDLFGFAVAMSGDSNTLAVGTPGASSQQGKSYVFTNPPLLTADGSTTNQSSTVGNPFTTSFAAHATDGYGNSLNNATITFSAPASGPSGSFVGGVRTATATSDANGFVTAPAFTAGLITGNYTVTASVTTTGGTATTSFSLTNTPGVPAKIAVDSGNSQSAQIGQAFAAPLTALVRDAYNNPAPGVTVTVTAPTGTNIPTATLSTTTATTNDAGIASVSATAAGRPGSFTVTASVGGVPTPATFGLTDLVNSSTLTLSGFSPPTGPTTGGTLVTLSGTNLSGATAVSFDGTAGTGITVNGSGTTLTVTAPAHSAAGTVDISVTTGSGGSAQTATIHGYTYLTGGSIAPAPTSHPLPGSTSGPAPMAQPARRDAPGGTGGTGSTPAPNALAPTAAAPPPTPNAEPERR